MNEEDQRQAVARQVIVSAGEILVAAGFDRQDISQFFRQAADQLSGQSAPVEVAASEDRADMGPVLAAFRRSKPVADLQPLIAQARKLESFGEEGPQLKAGFDLAMQMVPLIAEAQNGLRALAEEAGLPLYASRDEWMESAAGQSDPQPAICLEDFEPAYGNAFQAIAAVLEELLRREDAEAFTFLLGHLAENSVAIDSGLRALIGQAARLLPA